ncbi:hypothetical protein FGG08_003331 [Glutinoglossum americanum]|uniref:Uncharacterized protein n=1 Tax=Glutinoglossum americanum TaxID=1670608 RepID=A0A9P8IA06_9PEZI|nr:hypothetical protein FGG08_003331 [Glutinoglossum americanum]
MVLMGRIDPSGKAYDPKDGEEERKIEGLREILAARAYGPVTRSAYVKHLSDPTSFGVHLYRDEAAITVGQSEGYEDSDSRDTPILFADCEGFGAGSATTNAQRADSASYSLSRLISDLPITAASYGRDGKDGVDLFYARFLYAISDVVVFVMSGDTKLYPEMQKLAEWAASALYRSINHVAQKTLVIVRNMAGLHTTDLYSADTMKSSLFGNLGNLWEGSKILKTFRTNFNRDQPETHWIHDNDGLLNKLFSKVHFCYIPDAAKAPSSEVFGQYQILRRQIVTASQESQKLRSRAWMQYNVPMLSHILNRAFEHFRTSDDPFDFYKAARNDNPNPVSVSDHIANFLRHLHLTPGFPPSMIPGVISIGLMSLALRTFSSDTDPVGEPQGIFDRDLVTWCMGGLETFSKRDQRCGFKIEGKGDCVNRRASHEYEHCDEKGNRAAGLFDESNQLSPNTLSDINAAFVQQFRQICTDARGSFIWPNLEISRQARETVLQQYKAVWATVRSNKTCMTCLHAVPDHVLECGHTFCDQCVQEFGKPSLYFECGWTVDKCVLCLRSWRNRGPTFRLHPRCAGVRALTLDGGGIRGIIELALLEKIDAAIGLEIPIRDFFDIIVGTSTGGIISLGLATQEELGIPDLKREFTCLATETFRKTRTGSVMAVLDPLDWASKALIIMRVSNSVYRTTPLRESLQRLFGSERNLFSAAERTVRVAVTSSKDNGVDKCLIANYNRPTLDDDLDFEREDENDKELKIWEAALATAAAPFYFRKFEKPETKKNYTDGALHANFPVPYTLDEIARVWKRPDGEKVPLDLLLSLGTGIQEREIAIPTALRIGNFEAICMSFHQSLDCEVRWREFQRDRLQDNSELSGRVHRLNAKIGGSYVALDNHKRMAEIEAAVAKQQLTNPEFAKQIQHLGDLLIANLFFFEPTPPRAPRESTAKSSQIAHHSHISGSIRCRLEKDSNSLWSLIDIIDSFWYREISESCGVITSNMSMATTQGWTPIAVPEQHRRRVRSQKQWFRVECVVAPVEREGVLQVLGVSFRGRGSEEVLPISGFPVGWRGLRKRAVGV